MSCIWAHINVAVEATPKIKRVASRTLTPEIARQLIEERRTREVLSGFRSRNGKPFRARLVLNDEDKIEFEFPVRAQSKEPAATE